MTSIERLIHELAKLPGVGPRSARRLTLNLLKSREERIPTLVAALNGALAQVKTCSICGVLDECEPCHICSDATRDNGILCVVEDMADIWAMERSRVFRGRYHVLGGTLSAMDGRGPDSLRIDALMQRASGCKEVILALSATVAGQTTAHYVAERILSSAEAVDMHADGGNAPAARGAPITITRLAQGIPMGGELDYMDDGTIGAAFQARVSY
jgi:recombination protein RecR